MKLRPISKYHGGKYYLADWIISKFPKDYESYEYFEPYCGMASVLMQKKRRVAEYISDVDREIVNVLRVVRDFPNELQRELSLIEYTKENFENNLNKYNLLKCVPKYNHYYIMKSAIARIVVGRFSRGGLMKSFAWSNRLRSGQPGDANSWATFIQQIPQIADRLKGVFINCCDAFSMFDDPVYKAGTNHLWYIDCPYLQETRTTKNVYDFELSKANDLDDIAIHSLLAQKLNALAGRVYISGYASPLYDNLYQSDKWICHQREIANHSGQNSVKQKRIECLWEKKV